MKSPSFELVAHKLASHQS